MQLAALSELAALTHLSISKANDSSVQSLSGLMGLQELTVNVTLPFSLSALLPLTAFTQLTRLPAASGDSVGGDEFWVNFTSQVSFVRACSPCRHSLCQICPVPKYV